ncbi:MAG: tetratricopeptide repeat protein, partial [Prolixibacteraceae bacterium]
ERIRMDPGNSYWVNKLGLVFFSMGDYKNAAFYFSKYTALNSGDPLGYDNLGLAYQKLGETEKSEDNFKKAAKGYLRALKTDPENSVVLENFRKSCSSISHEKTRKKLHKQALETEGIDKSILLRQDYELNL